MKKMIFLKVKNSYNKKLVTWLDLNLQVAQSYRALVRIYHPDLNPHDIELFTEITQNLNNAYEKLQKTYGK